MPPKKTISGSDVPDYVGSYGEHRLLTEKDLAGFYSFAKYLLNHDKHQNFLYVGLGRSPVVLMEFMRQFFPEIETLELPLSVSMTNDTKAKVGLSSDMESHIANYLPLDRTRGKTLVLIDYVDTGDSLVIAYQLIQKYLQQNGQSEEAEKLLMAPIGVLHKAWNKSLKDELIAYGDQGKLITQGYDYKTRAAYHMIKVLHFQIDKDGFSAFPKVRFTDISAGKVHKRDPLVEKRLQDVVKLAIESVDSSPGARELKLKAAQWTATKNRSPREPQMRNYNINLPKAMQYGDRLSDKSAKYYGIYSGFWTHKLATSVWMHGSIAVIVILLFVALLYGYYSSSSSSNTEL